MGRPIQSSVFGDVALPGFQFAITAKIPGEAVAEGYIIEQQGTAKYRVNINGTEGVVFLVNTLTPANLNDGEAFVAVTPFGGSTVAASKIMQRKVNVFNIVDSPFSTYSSYKWSDLPAAATGEADVGVSTAVTGNTLNDTSMFVFEQEDPQNAPTKYITTFRAFGWSNQSVPNGAQHFTFATSDNKIVIFHESDFTNGVVDGGAVTVLDGTAAGSVPTVIGGSAITSTWESGEIDEHKTLIIQLTDTRYVRISQVDTTGPTNSQRLELIDVNLTTGAAAIDITHDLEQYFSATRQATNNANINLIKISSTRFGVVFTDVGVTTSTTVDGALYAMVFNDLGTSVSVQMAKTVMIDMTDPANNEGDTLADVGRMAATYIGGTTKAIVATYETTRNTLRDVCVVACELNGTDSGISTNGALKVVLDAATYTGGFQPRAVPINDTHFLFLEEDRRAGADTPLLGAICEVNTTTYAITNGTLVRLGIAPGGDLGQTRIDEDYGVVIDSDTKAYIHTGFEDNLATINTGTVAANVEPFDSSMDLNLSDRVVDLAANLNPDWSGSTNGVLVLAADDGFVYQTDGLDNWTKITLNAARRDYRGQAVMELTMDLGAKTVTTTKQEMMASEQFPRFASDGAGGVTNLGKNPAFETDSNKIIKLPNGKFVTSCEAVQRIDTNAPFFNKTDYDTGQANLELGGEYAIQFFDPTKMP